MTLEPSPCLVSAMEEISAFVEENTEAEIIGEEREIR